jgi:predicted dehydrogenase
MMKTERVADPQSGTFEPEASRASDRPRHRVGFLGVGWIGRHRLQSIAETGSVEIAALVDADTHAAAAAAAEIPTAAVLPSLDALLQHNLDALVIATPTALHAEQSIMALESGLAVFCQKPLGRTGVETRRVVETARQRDRLLAVDMSYRFVRGLKKIKAMADAGEIGDIYAMELIFHNAYGPDKAWYYDPLLSGGGCVIDLGIHLIDVALWLLNFPQVQHVSSRLFSQGRRLTPKERALEDYTVTRLDLETGATVSISCSWRLPAGCDALIRGSFYGTKGGLALHNVNGSFYDFRAEHFHGTSRKILDEPPDDWGGRAAVAWATSLAGNGRYEPEVERSIEVADVIDAIYGR